MAGDIRYLTVSAMTSMATAGTADEQLVCIPEAGEFILEAATFTPATAVTANDTNYATLALKIGAGGTAVATARTTQVTGGAALVKGTPWVFTLAASGATRTFTGQTDALEISKAVAGSGAVIEGVFSFAFRKVRL